MEWNAAWQHMMVLGLPVIEKILRPIFVYVFLIVGLRIGGKRELAQLNPFDLVVLLTLSNVVQNAIIGEDNSVIGGIIGASTLLAVNHFVVKVLFSHDKLERVVEGASVKLVVHGQVQNDKLQSELITLQELELAARRQGMELHAVEDAVLESSGSISFVAKSPTAEVVRYQQLMDRLDRLSADVQEVRLAVSRTQ